MLVSSVEMISFMAFIIQDKRQQFGIDILTETEGYHRVSKVAAPVTFGITRPKESQLSGSFIHANNPSIAFTESALWHSWRLRLSVCGEIYRWSYRSLHIGTHSWYWSYVPESSLWWSVIPYQYLDLVQFKGRKCFFFIIFMFAIEPNICGQVMMN